MWIQQEEGRLSLWHLDRLNEWINCSHQLPILPPITSVILFLLKVVISLPKVLWLHLYIPKFFLLNHSNLITDELITRIKLPIDIFFDKTDKLLCYIFSNSFINTVSQIIINTQQSILVTLLVFKKMFNYVNYPNYPCFMRAFMSNPFIEKS